ncbi:rod shape-determining protein MreD [Peribacillus asahii]|uniref:rod shape-determining protein MreD n=1 Tax=Peribacillus asahii TaxID=228899 RepID=UPI00381F0CFF
MKHFILSLIALIFFVFDSIFAQLFASELFGKGNILVPHFMMVFIFFLTIFGSRRYGMIYGAVLGLAYDVVYTEILGIFMFLIPFLAYLMAKCMKVLQSNWLIIIVVSTVFIAISEMIVYEMNVIMSFAALTFAEFAERRLWPTALLNLVFIIASYYPIQKLIRKIVTKSEMES